MACEIVGFLEFGELLLTSNSRQLFFETLINFEWFSIDENSGICLQLAIWGFAIHVIGVAFTFCPFLFPLITFILAFTLMLVKNVKGPYYPITY